MSTTHKPQPTASPKQIDLIVKLVDEIGQLDPKSPAEREKWCIEEAEELRANVCTSGYTVLGDVDINA